MANHTELANPDRPFSELSCLIWHATPPNGRPFSELYIGMKDADTLLGMGDDDIGRVVISVAQLHAATEYDCWMPLQRETITLEVP